MGKRLLLSLFSLLFSAGIAMAQTVVSGTVVSAEDGEPIIGASVLIKGTKQGVATDIDGNFSIKTSQSNPQVVISYIGMQTVTLKGKQGMKIQMEPDQTTQRLDEVQPQRWMQRRRNWTVLPTYHVPLKVVPPV